MTFRKWLMSLSYNLLVSSRQKVTRCIKTYLASLEWQGLILFNDDDIWHFGKFCCNGGLWLVSTRSRWILTYFTPVSTSCELRIWMWMTCLLCKLLYFCMSFCIIFDLDIPLLNFPRTSTSTATMKREYTLIVYVIALFQLGFITRYDV